MRRKKDRPIPLELDMLRAARALYERGVTEFHGHLLAKELSGLYNPRKLVGYGTLYKALDRLEKNGFLESEWEDPSFAAEQRRPRRRLYTMAQERTQSEPFDLVTAIETLGELAR